MRLYLLLYVVLALTGICLLVACSSARSSKGQTVATVLPVTPPPVLKGTSGVIPRAVVYRTVADFHDKVPVTMDVARTAIVSYPDPKDVRVGKGYAVPVALRDGYWLDRRGINVNTAFLDYTYEAYAALEKAPSMEVLKKHLLHTHPLTVLYVLPISHSEAQADTSRCNSIIANGFKGCVSLWDQTLIPASESNGEGERDKK